MTIKITTIQRGSDRYTFVKEAKDNKETYCIKYEHCYDTGSSLSYRYTTKDEGNELYTSLMKKGFRRFRNIREVSWYATRTNNTPYDEEWTIEGTCLVPVKSRVLQ